MRELSTFEKARILIRAATGEEYGDGKMITDLCVGYAEPGYGTNESVIALGNFNPKRWVREGDPPLTKAESLPVRLADALDRIGVNCEWYDEWTRCDDCYRIFRLVEDSYHWTMDGAYDDNGNCYCADCILKNDFESYLQENYINNHRNALTFGKADNLEALGFESWEAHNKHVYANGWFGGMDDTPEEVTAHIRREFPDAEIVFFIEENSQFYMRFSAYYREKEDNDGTDEEKG